MTAGVLTIAGSDSSGGAGIQADLRVFRSAGVPACSAVTAVTAQGPDGVAAVELVSPQVVCMQIAQAFKALDIRAVKIGMLGSEDQVRAVVDTLKRLPGCPLVLDPVLASSSGTSLLTEAGRQALLEELMPLASVVTPNIDELAQLTDLPVGLEDERIQAAQVLLQRGAQAVLVKGGHLEDDPIDVLIELGSTPYRIVGKRVKTRDSRGTGCVLSSLLTVYLGAGRPLVEALGWAKWHLMRGLEDPIVLRGGGYPSMRSELQLGPDSAQISGVYLVTNAELTPAVSHAMAARMALDGGAGVIQLREKRYTTPELVHLAKRMKTLAHQRGGLFIVNDRVDVALASGADGVHLGPDDMRPEDARVALGPHKLIGVSVGTMEEAKQLAPHASYLAVGAIFGSTTKDDAGPPVGLGFLRVVRDAFPEKRIVAIGGINLSNIASVAEAGADAAAVVSAIVCADDPEAATRALVAEFERGRARAAASVTVPTIHAEDLRKRIDQVFPADQRSTEEIFQHLEGEHESELDHYRGRNWRELYDEIGRQESLQDLYWLNEKGMLLFLPAFMSTLLDRPREMADELVEKLCLEESSEPKISSLATAQQRRFIADFLAWLKPYMEVDPESLAWLIEAYLAFSDTR